MKAEHFERQVQRVEQERDQWEKKYEVRISASSNRHIHHITNDLPLFCVTGCGYEVPGIKEGARRVGLFHGQDLNASFYSYPITRFYLTHFLYPRNDVSGV